MIDPDLNRSVDRAFRTSYGKLLALLIQQGFELEIAEDAIGAALAEALHHWKTETPPAQFEGWLFTVAKHRAIDLRRRDSRLERLPSLETETSLSTQAMTVTPDPEPIPDERLRLFLLCTHPSIDTRIQTPLMLQLILGFQASDIAAAYLVPEDAMAQRLVRAKRKIRDAAIPLELPSENQLPERLEAVLQALYALYNRGWDQPTNPDHLSTATEALELVQVLARLQPDYPEVLGLAALMLYCESRRAARRDSLDQFVPLEDQDLIRWDTSLIEQAETFLNAASKARQPGRFQLEAAIQSAHVSRRRTGWPTYSEILRLYDALIQLAPTLSAKLARIVALGEHLGAAHALTELEQLIHPNYASFQPYWAVRAHLLTLLGDESQAAQARSMAKSLSEDQAVRAFFGP